MESSEAAGGEGEVKEQEGFAKVRGGGVEEGAGGRRGQERESA